MVRPATNLLQEMTPDMTPDNTPAEPAPPDLRPLGVGEILDAAFRMLRQNFGAYLRIGVWFLTLPVVLLGVYMASQILFIRDDFIFVEDPDTYEVAAFALGMIARFIQILCFGVLVHLSTRLYMNHRETAGSIIRLSGKRLASFFGLTILLGLYAFGVLIVASMLAVPLGLLGVVVILAALVGWATYYSLAAPAFWHEGIRVGKAIGRSAALVRNRFWQVFSSLVVAFIIVGVFTVGLGALLLTVVFQVESKLPYIVLTLGLEYIGNLVSIITLAPIVTVVYFDGLVRKEGYDMKLKLDPEQTDEPPPPVPW